MRDVKHRGGGVSRIRRKSGQIVYRARARVDGAEVALGVYESEEDAREAVRQAIGQLVSEDLRLPGAQTLGDWGLDWLDRRERGTVRGVRQERSVWRTHVASTPMAALPLRSITRPMIVRWVDGLIHGTTALRPLRGQKARDTGRPLSRLTVTHALRVLRSCLRDAVDAGKIDANPAQGVRVPAFRRDGDDDPRWSWLTVEEIDRLINTPRTHRPRKGIRKTTVVRTHEVDVPEELRLAWTILIYTGLRPPSELLRLRWSDVRDLDGDRPYLYVARGKTGRDREVPLLPPARDALKRWRRLSPGLGAARVFPRRKDWDVGWRRWAVSLLGRHVRLYDTRHTCASHLVQGTWGRALSLYEVGQWLGHTSTQTTARYAHLAPEALRGVAAEMAEAWPSRAGTQRARGHEAAKRKWPK